MCLPKQAFRRRLKDLACKRNVGGRESTWALKSRELPLAQEEGEARDLNPEKDSTHCFWLKDEGCPVSRNAGSL